MTPLMELTVSVMQQTIAPEAYAYCIILSVQEHQDTVSDLLMHTFRDAHLCLVLDASFSLTDAAMH